MNWMNLLGDPPASNPAYDWIQPIFVSLPFIIGPLIIGLIAGFGMVTPWWRIAVRFVFGPLLSLPILTKESPQYTKSYIPILLSSFVISLAMAIIYQLLSIRRGNPSSQNSKR
jgi:MFS family permease